jgi:DNA-binding response OmpR family regulator
MREKNGPELALDRQQIKIFGEKRHNLEIAAHTGGLHKALVVEDDNSFAFIVKQYMESWGYTVTIANDGVQGIKRVIADDYSIILCDMLMPNLAGDMFYKAVERVKPKTCKRFIFMTGNHNDENINKFIREVKGLIIWKPFKMHVLHETVQAVERKYGRTAK